MVIILLILVVIYITLKLCKLDIHPDINSFFINLISGMVVVSLTIWGIDSLIRKRKDKKIKDINKEQAHIITSSLNVLMYRILLKFNLMSKEDGMKDIDFSNAYEEFKKTENTEAILKAIHEKLASWNKENVKFLKSFDKEILDSLSSVGKQIENIKPYPKPEIMEKISDIAYSLGIFNTTTEIADIYLQHPEFKNHPDNDKFEVGLKAVQESLYRDTTELRTESRIRDMFKKIIDIRNCAPKNELDYDIY